MSEELQPVKPSLKELARDWQWLFDASQYRLLAVSPFGDLLLEDQTNSISLLDINLGQLLEAASVGSAAELFPENFDDRIARGYREAQLLLKPGTCYRYKVQTVAGGSIDPGNVYIATLCEYVSFMGCFHQQIRDVAEGDSVVIKVVRSPVN